MMRADAPLTARLDWAEGIPLLGVLAGVALVGRGDGRVDLIAAALIGAWICVEALRGLRGAAAA